MTDRKRALSALGLGAALTLGAVACGGDDGDGGDSVFSLGVGQCIDDFQAVGQVNEVPTIDCAEPHMFEVYATFDLEGDEYPGLDQVEVLAAAGCEERFEPYVGIDFASSALNINYLYPLEDGWNEINDREVVCFAFNLDGTPLTGSIQGTAR